MSFSLYLHLQSPFHSCPEVTKVSMSAIRTYISYNSLFIPNDTGRPPSIYHHKFAVTKQWCFTRIWFDFTWSKIWDSHSSVNRESNLLSCYAKLIFHSTVGPRFATVCFAMGHLTTIHFYDPCPVGPSTPDLWCITVTTQVSFLYSVQF